MTLNELKEQYNFHDSLLEEISIDKALGHANFVIDFCFWQQKDYKESGEETGLIKLIFSGLKKINIEPAKFDDDTIISCKLQDTKTLVFTVLQDMTNKNYEIIISANNVEFQKL